MVPGPWVRLSRTAPPVLDTLTAETFAPYVRARFTIETDDGTELEVDLAEVTRWGRGAPSRRQPFTLLFRGPTQPVLGQRIRRISHAELGELELFLVPIGPIDGGIGYEAVFS